MSGRHASEADLIAETDLAAITSIDPELVLADEGGGVRPMEDATDARKEFEEFFRAEYPRLVYVIMRLGSGLTEAEDVVADVMTRMYQRWADITDPAGYAYRSVVNGYRTKSRLAGRTVPLNEAEADLPGLDALDLGGRERRVFDAINRLSPAQRLVMAMHYAGLSTAEIATETDTSEATVRSNLRHARQRLRALLVADDLL